MTSAELLEAVYRSEDLKRCVSKIRIEIRDDVLQHTFLELLERPEQEIIDLHKRGKLTAYIAKMLYNMVYWQGSSFNRQAIKEVILETLPEIVEEELEEIIVPMNKLYWYDAKLLELYAEHGTYRKVAEITGIEYSGICKTVQRARKILKKHL